jgi:FKBP-type peptidyl-prolyl cis-trans isomerase
MNLMMEILHAGSGSQAEAGQIVVVHYTGWLTDGTKFDSSVDRNEPFEIAAGVGQVIEGWDLALVRMRVGDRARLTIPPNLAYGDAGVGGVIPGKATLIFEVELLEVK